MKMTKEEARAFLTNISYNLGTVDIEYLSVKDGEKMRDAIKALEQEPTTNNDLGVDCISREQALNEFCIYNPYDSIGVDKVRSYLKALPSVTPQEPKTGRWIMTGNYLTTAYGSIDYVECSCCGEDSLEEGNFCPNCGAKMVNLQESEDN